MNRSILELDSWNPLTQEDRQAILQELNEILASPHFCNSKRYPALLKFVVENTLNGKSNLLKERTLGIEVFDRAADYDTNSDTVVRYTAGEVRKRLQLYYLEHSARSGVRISLPAGSYVPEFLVDPLRNNDNLGDSEQVSSAPQAQVTAETAAAPLIGDEELRIEPGDAPQIHSTAPSPTALGATVPSRRLLWLLGTAAVVILATTIGITLKSRSVHSGAGVSEFWTPVIRDSHFVIVCTGASVFSNNDFSGVATAGKDIDYPFVSMQIASSISQISGTLSQLGVSTQLSSSASTPLTELREHSITLLGGYNNQWTMRVLQPLRFHFTPEPIESIVDQMHPGTHWQRDHNVPYSSADDYALLARFRDPTIDGWVVVAAGLGRNGTEAASQFSVSPHYLQLLGDQIGHDLAYKNLEVLLKVKVIEGKTGAPSILAVHTW